MEARLQALTGPLEGSTIALPRAPFRLGRHLSNDLSLSDTLVSRYHCEIRPGGTAFTLVDLGSQNGTFLNGQRVTEHALKDGDELAIGRSVLVFHAMEGTENAESAADLFHDGPVGTTTIALRPEESRYLKVRDEEGPSSDRTARHLRAFMRVATTIHSQRELEAVSRDLLAILLEVIPAERGAIFLVETPDDLRCACAFDRRSNSSKPFRVSRAIVRRALGDRTGLLVQDALNSAPFRPTESIVAARASSILAVPLLVLDRAVGLIYLDNTFASAFADDDLEILAAIGASAAIAIDNTRHLEWLQNELRRESSLPANIIGDSPPMRKIQNLLTRVAPTDSTVLLEGESGTGKELAARALHQLSRRTTKPFVPLNCAALAPSLVEAELFGYEKGAFTGAAARKDGKLESAQGGTLFLDEIGEMDINLQAKLLRVLQNREYQRLGSTRTQHVDVRVVAATNKDLKAAIGRGEFREDLYFRLNVFPIRMPPLRERKEDIAVLATFFVEKACEHIGRPALQVSPEAQRLLLAYDWPGNVRELENACERAAVMCAGKAILPEDLPESILEVAEPYEEGLASYHEAVNAFKKDLVIRTLQQAGGSYPEAARQLGLHPNNLHRLIRNLGIKEAVRSTTG